MIPTPGHLSDKRQKLSEQIARQRTELAVAYRGLIKPFQYADTSVVALNALRKNGWLISMAPSVVSLVFSFFGWEKKGKPSLLGRLRGNTKGAAKEESVKQVSRAGKPLARWGARAWSAFQVYRKVRPYFLP